MNEMIQLNIRKDFFDDIGGTLPQVDQKSFLQRLGRRRREYTEDRRERLSEIDLLYDAIAEARFHNRSNRVYSNIGKEKTQQLLIELPLRTGCHDAIGDRWHIGLFVRACARECIINISDGHDAGKTMDLIALQMIGIAGAVQMLMMLQGNRGNQGGGQHQLFQLLSSRLRMHADDIDFILIEPAGLVQDCIGDDQLPDIMQQTAQREIKKILLGIMAQESEHG